MSYQEKRSIVSIATGIIVLAAYAIYVRNRMVAGLLPADDLRAWAVAMLIFIGIGVVATIIIQIVFHILMSVSIAVKHKIEKDIVDEKEIERTIDTEMTEDEMDKLISLKSDKVGFICAGTGFMAALVSLLFNASPALMLNILFVSFSVGSLIEGISQIYYYRKGI
ncbi:hypothetical protein SDC9_123715 [bioreactor metagenome]|uniref:Uncharacterized protein n=1 Tax=bioreactor metagenome TaxID=1076179 RepID=A0A645CID2_9ZZZZ